MFDSAAPWTIAHQAPLTMEFSRQEYSSRLPFPPPGDLPDPGMEPTSPALTGGLFTTEPQNPYSVLCIAVFKRLSVSQFSRSVVPDSLRPHESQHARPLCPSPTPGVYPNANQNHNEIPFHTY